MSLVVKKISIRTARKERGEGEGETKKKVVGSGVVVLRAQQRCAGIGIVCNAIRTLQDEAA